MSKIKVLLTPAAVSRLARDLGLFAPIAPKAPRSPYNASGPGPGLPDPERAAQAFPGQPGAFPAPSGGSHRTEVLVADLRPSLRGGASFDECEHDFDVFSGTCARCGAGGRFGGEGGDL